MHRAEENFFVIVDILLPHMAHSLALRLRIKRRMLRSTLGLETSLFTLSNRRFQGRVGVEWVIDHLKKEWRDLSDKVSSGVHEMEEKLRHAWQDQTR